MGGLVEGRNRGTELLFGSLPIPAAKRFTQAAQGGAQPGTVVAVHLGARFGLPGPLQGRKVVRHKLADVLCLGKFVVLKGLFYGFGRLSVNAKGLQSFAMKASLRLAAVCLTLIGTLACSMWKNPGKGWNGATAGEELEKLFWNDLKTRNFTELEAHISSTVIATTSAGTFDKAAWLQHLKEAQLEDFSLGDVEVKSNGADMIVTYIINLKGTSHGQPLPARERMLTVWQPVGKSFLIVAHSAIPMAAEAASTGK